MLSQNLEKETLDLTHLDWCHRHSIVRRRLLMRQKNPLAVPLDDSTPTDFRRLGFSCNEQDKPRGTYENCIDKKSPVMLFEVFAYII